MGTPRCVYCYDSNVYTVKRCPLCLRENTDWPYNPKDRKKDRT